MISLQKIVSSLYSLLAPMSQKRIIREFFAGQIQGFDPQTFENKKGVRTPSEIKII
jgi:hypothetical protein